MKYHFGLNKFEFMVDLVADTWLKVNSTCGGIYRIESPSDFMGYYCRVSQNMQRGIKGNKEYFYFLGLKKLEKTFTYDDPAFWTPCSANAHHVENHVTLGYNCILWETWSCLGKPSKKKSFNKEIFLKGGRGSIWKPNFFLAKK